jgi:hypothetical protein
MSQTGYHGRVLSLVKLDVYQLRVWARQASPASPTGSERDDRRLELVDLAAHAISNQSAAVCLPHEALRG